MNNKLKPFWRKSFYCGGAEDEYCGKCRVCKYLDWRDWVDAIGKPPESVVEYDDVVEIFWNELLPAWDKMVAKLRKEEEEVAAWLASEGRP